METYYMFRPSSVMYSTEKNTVMTKKNNSLVITVFVWLNTSLKMAEKAETSTSLYIRVYSSQLQCSCWNV